MNTKRILLVVAVASMLVFAGCTGTDDTGDATNGGDLEDDVHPDDGADGSSTIEGDTDHNVVRAGDDLDPAALAAERRLIRTGEIRLTVEEYTEAETEVRNVADEYGGFVSETTRETNERYDEEFTSGELVIRVPSDDFDAAMADIETIGDVETMRTETEDVSDQLTDLNARLANLRAERDRLRELYDDANGTADVLAVQSELASTQSEIERLEARQADLEGRVALSTIRVELVEESPEFSALEPDAWYETGVSAAFLDSVSGVGTVIRAVVVGVAYALPYAITFGLPLVVVGVLARRVSGDPRE